jgi:TatD DNase family protein
LTKRQPGLHPWFVEEFFKSQGVDADTGSITRALQALDDGLAQRLCDNPCALVGELGLDHVATDPSSGQKYRLDWQLEAFKRQLSVVTRFKRPCSVHCVQAYGQLFDLLSQMSASELPPLIMLHSYTGSADIIHGLLKQKHLKHRLYFSVSHLVTARLGQKKLAATLRAIPDNRFLLESDSGCTRDVDDLMMKACELVSRIKGWTMEDTFDRAFVNSRAFFADAFQHIEIVFSK